MQVSDNDQDTKDDIDIKVEINFDKTSNSIPEISDERSVEEGFVCLLCDLTYPKEIELIQHVAEVHGIKIQCLICNLLFKSSVELKEHAVSVHDKKPLYDCTECKLEFVNEIEMEEHVSLIHESKETFKCSICDEKFTEKIMLKKHKKKIHRFKVYKCKLCSKSFKTQKLMTRHNEKLCPLKKCLDGFKENSHICSFCGKKYTSQSGLFHHVTTVHEGRTFQCLLCNTGDEFSETFIFSFFHYLNLFLLDRSRI